MWSVIYGVTAALLLTAAALDFGKFFISVRHLTLRQAAVMQALVMTQAAAGVGFALVAARYW